MLQAIQSTISDIDSVGDPTAMSVDSAKALEWWIKLVYRDLIAKEVAGELVSEEQEVLPIIVEAYLHLRELVQSIKLLLPPRAQPFQVIHGVRRLPYHISYHQLDALISMHFSIPQIARVIGVSVSTVRRCMSE